ncbi:MAG: aspartyl protease family protein [Chloroflexota bacterium]|nr:aspartyl protease family protein [Chloroflexota bacterium]MDE2960031.1 aspartyl protease family protein [Chloroflexota bacterium]
MGTFNITIEIGNLNGEHFEDVDVMVDTGAISTIVPRDILEGLGIQPTKGETFEYAGGEQVQLDMTEARARVDGRETITWVIFGEEGASTLLGAYTLEGVFLGVGPYNQRLIPVTGSLK